DRQVVSEARFAIISICCSASTGIMSAEAPMTGEWILDMRPAPNFVYFSIHRRSERGGSFSSSSDIRADSIKGLSEAQASSNGSPVSFQVVRDAGTLNCEGWFKQGKGSGTFTFVPNP